MAERLPNDTIYVEGHPYLTRYYLNGRPWRKLGEGRSIRLHHFHTSDQGRELHNHPFEGWSLVLSGGYVEERRAPMASVLVPVNGSDECYERHYFRQTAFRVLTPGSVNRIGLDVFHRAELLDPVNGCWTLFVTGKRVADWGFWNKKTGHYTPHAEYVHE